MGYFAVQRQWGTFWSNAQVYISGLDVSKVAPFLEDLRVYFSDQSESILIHLDNRYDYAILGPALIESGCTGPTSDVYLAHILRQQIGVNGAVQMVPVTNENLAIFADTKIRAWDGNEDDPNYEELQDEIARREREIEGTGRGLIAIENDVPKGFIWWHENPERVRWISQLAVRSPFRKQGVGTKMIMTCLETAYTAGNIGVVINVEPDNHVAFELYQRLGFLDPVYDLHTYTLIHESQSE